MSRHSVSIYDDHRSSYSARTRTHKTRYSADRAVTRTCGVRPIPPIPIHPPRPPSTRPTGSQPIQPSHAPVRPTDEQIRTAKRSAKCLPVEREVAF